MCLKAAHRPYRCRADLSVAGGATVRGKPQAPLDVELRFSGTASDAGRWKNIVRRAADTNAATYLCLQARAAQGKMVARAIHYIPTTAEQ